MQQIERTGELAKRAGVSPSAVSNYKAGRLDHVGKTSIAKIEEALGIKMSSAELIRAKLLRGDIIGFHDGVKCGSARLSDVIFDMRRDIERQLPNIGRDERCEWTLIQHAGKVPVCDFFIFDRGVYSLLHRKNRTEYATYWIPDSVRKALEVTK